MKALLFSTIILALYIPAPEFDDGHSSISIQQSVDDDLKAFGEKIGIEKYLALDSSLVTEPIILYFAESASEDYLDLLYIFDPAMQFDCFKIYSDCAVGNTDDYQNYSTYCWTDASTPLYYSGSSLDGKIKRYALNLYDFGGIVDYRLYYNYRYYSFYELYYEDRSGNQSGIDVDANYLYSSYGTVDYSTCCNVALGDPHVWSYHFDEDEASENWWEGIKNFFGYPVNESLRDYLFYSFYFKDWKVNQIRSIDLSYRKALLMGLRCNIADSGVESTYFKGNTINIPESETYPCSPRYYAWSDENYSSDLPDTTNYLGSSIDEISAKVPLTSITIRPESVSSVGVKHNYSWNKIQSLSSFESSFGSDSDIYSFASQFMTEADEDYWIINFDSYYYNYEVRDSNIIRYTPSEPSYVDLRQGENTYGGPDEVDLFNWLSEGVNNEKFDYVQNGDYYELQYYPFSQEYVFDLKATSITFDDSNGITYTRPVSVVLSSEESSGGNDENPDISEVIDEVMNNIGNFFAGIGNWFNGLFSNLGAFGDFITKYGWLILGITAALILIIIIINDESKRRNRRKKK